MKTQTIKKFFACITMIIFTIAVPLFNSSCSKDKNSPDPGKTTGSSKIVYTDVNPNSVITSTYNLNLNNDSFYDFTFNYSTHSGPLCHRGCNYDPAIEGYSIVKNREVSPANSNAIISDGNNFPLALDSLAVIDGSSHWSVLPSQVLSNGAYCPYCGFISAQGNWIKLTPGDKYLGLKLINGANTYYGWVRLFVWATAALTVKDYAYNSIPNQPILAGQTK